jgi:hypothetical protein
MPTIPIRDAKGHFRGTKVVPDDATPPPPPPTMPEQAPASPDPPKVDPPENATEVPDDGGDDFFRSPSPDEGKRPPGIEPDEVLDGDEKGDGDGGDDDDDTDQSVSGVDGAEKKTRKGGGGSKQKKREKASLLAGYILSGADGAFGMYVGFRHGWMTLIAPQLPEDIREQFEKLQKLTDVEKALLSDALTEYLIENDLDIPPGWMLLIVAGACYGGRIAGLELARYGAMKAQ